MIIDEVYDGTIEVHALTSVTTSKKTFTFTATGDVFLKVTGGAIYITNSDSDETALEIDNSSKFLPVGRFKAGSSLHIRAKTGSVSKVEATMMVIVG